MFLHRLSSDAVCVISHIPEGQHKTLQQIKILYVEDYDLVLFTVKQLFELEGWQVDVCRDGIAALKKLESAEHYDIIVLDFELPGVGGVELLCRARELSQRRDTPIIMFTASDCEREARAAGVNEFLKKPGGIKDLVLTVERFLDEPEITAYTSDTPTSVKFT